MLDISVIVINYNTADLISACVDSVLKQKNVSLEIIVVDNASSDNSVKIIRQFGNKIHFFENAHNIGFGKANNQAFSSSKGRYLFLLNPDAQFLSENDLQNVVYFMEMHPEYGLVGTRILDDQDKVKRSASECYPGEDIASVDFSKLPGEWASVLGASMIIHRSVFEQLGGFDEDFFLYAEEIDLALRVRKLGYSIGYCNTVSVKHIGGASERKSPAEDVVRKKQQAKYLFYKKHYIHNDLIKLAKRDLFRSRRRCLRLTIQKKLFGLNLPNQFKLRRYQTVRAIAKEFLENGKKKTEF